MASFQPKIGWKWLRKRENKNYTSVTFLPDGLEKTKIIVPLRFYTTLIENNKKIGKKILKTKKYRYVFFSSQNRLEKAEKERK